MRKLKNAITILYHKPMKTLQLKINDTVQFEAGGFYHVGSIVEQRSKNYFIIKESDDTLWPVNVNHIKKVLTMTFNMEQIKFTAQDLAATLKKFDEEINKLNHNCVECSFFTKSTYHCNKWNSQVPAETIIIGCDSFTNEVPF